MHCSARVISLRPAINTTEIRGHFSESLFTTPLIEEFGMNSQIVGIWRMGLGRWGVRNMAHLVFFQAVLFSVFHDCFYTIFSNRNLYGIPPIYFEGYVYEGGFLDYFNTNKHYKYTFRCKHSKPRQFNAEKAFN